MTPSTSFVRSSTGDVQDCIGRLGLLFQQLDRFGGGQYHQFDLPAFGFPFHLLHDRQLPMDSGSDNELAAFPRHSFFDRKWRMAKVITKLLGWLLLALAGFSAINHYVMLMDDAVDFDCAERETFKPHIHSVLRLLRHRQRL